MNPEDDGIVIIEDFISHDDCQYLINTYNSKVFRSTVNDTTKGSAAVHESRTSSTYYMPGSDTVVKKLRQKTAELLNIPEENIEGLQFLRYLHGEQYRYHHDYLAGGDTVKNQRVHTVLLYLNTLEPEDGGATSFFHYKKKVSPKEGRAVWFRNMNVDGTLNDKSLHSGEMILKEGVVKYAVNIWTRQTKW